MKKRKKELSFFRKTFCHKKFLDCFKTIIDIPFLSSDCGIDVSKQPTTEQVSGSDTTSIQVSIKQQKSLLSKNVYYYIVHLDKITLYFLYNIDAPTFKYHGRKCHPKLLSFCSMC